MKSRKSLLALSIALIVLAFTACGSPGGSNNSSGNGSRQNDGSIRGIVTAVSGNSVEIALMQGGRQNGDSPQGTGNPPQGSGGNRRQGNGDGTPPSGSFRPQGSMDLSNAEKKQYTVDANTKIVKREFSGRNGQGQNQGQNQGNVTETSASLSDITAGTMVSITLRNGSDSIADKISITSGGFNGNRSQDGNPPQGSAPAAS
jgi:hypothetical protein